MSRHRSPWALIVAVDDRQRLFQDLEPLTGDGRTVVESGPYVVLGNLPDSRERHDIRFTHAQP